MIATNYLEINFTTCYKLLFTNLPLKLSTFTLLPKSA